MEINKIAFGNEEEAFMECDLAKGVNIIYSDDNNKGKTLLIQGAMYALGNEPIFPIGFEWKNYYFYVLITKNNIEYEFLRKNNTTIIKTKDALQICESISELKYYINKNIFALPSIIKDNHKKIVDPVLFYQLFFVGQDKRDTSNLINRGYYNKSDFINMLSDLNGSFVDSIGNIDSDNVKKQIKEKEIEIKETKKLLTLLKDNPPIAEFISNSLDKENFEKKSGRIKELQESILYFRKSRTRELIRKTKLENTLGELKALNQNIKAGKITCANCGSTNINYSNDDISFDISNLQVRKQILNAIDYQIDMKKENIEELSRNIKSHQEKFKQELKTIPVKLQNLFLYRQDILSNENYAVKLDKLTSELYSLKDVLASDSELRKNTKKENEAMSQKLIELMNAYYLEVDPSGNLVFEGLFSKKDVTFSGSEEQEFYYCKLLALNAFFKHEFPIIMDSFRDGELSSYKEAIMLKNYKKLNKQIILTATLKEEEYVENNYKNLTDINAIDYSKNQPSHILQETYVTDFKDILATFKIKMQN